MLRRLWVPKRCEGLTMTLFAAISPRPPSRFLFAAVAALAVVALSACEPQGFFPDDIPRDPKDGPCSADVPQGDCPDGETCKDGECLGDDNFCSAENPAGLCSDPDETCVGGSCLNQSNACSPQKPDGDCPDNLTCTNGFCASENPCAPNERFGFCDGDNVCIDGGCVPASSVCDDDTPNGLCPSGLTCSAGICVSRDDVCGCNEVQTCLDGICRDPEVLCSPAVPDGLCSGGAVCTAGACVDVGAGCSAQNPTGVCSPGSICRVGTCTAVDGAALCDDDNPCTIDSFDPTRNRCNNAPDDESACDDGNACTNDTCSAGVCVGAAIAQCVEPPVLDDVVTPTNIGTLVIAGTKPVGAAIDINELIAVAESPDARFSVTVNLSPGDNIFRIKSVDQGTSSGVRELRVVYDITPPTTRVTPEGGRFVSGVTATIASDEPATIFFTTDGSTPDETAQSFTSLKQLRVHNSVTLKLRAKDLAGNLQDEIQEVTFEVTARGSNWRQATVLEEPLSHVGTTFAGNTLFLAGGTDGLAAQAGAFSLDVDTDTWRTLPSLAGARAGLSMVVRGNDVYAIGGENAGNPLNRVEVLRADATAWETLAPMPSTRHAAGAVVVNGEIFVFGGLANGGAVLQNVEVYNIANNTWRNDVAPMPRIRAGFGVALFEGKIYLVGGEGTGGALIGEVDVYEVATNTWTQVAPLPTPRSFLAVGLVENVGRVSSGDHGIVAAGGRIDGGNGTAIVEEYIVEDDRWSIRALLPTVRHSAGSAIVTVADDVDDVAQELWMIGGQVQDTLSDKGLAFRTNRDHVRRMPDLPEARFLHGATVLGDRVYLFGGRNFSEETDTWAFDPETGTYESLPALPSIQNAPVAVTVGDLVYAIGGFDGFGNAIATTRAYDPVARTWSNRQPMTSGRGNAAAVVVGTDIHVIGGENGAALPTVEIYDTLTNTWRAGPLLPAGRAGAMAVAHKGRVVVFGGENGTGLVTSVVRRTDVGWETLSGSVDVAYGYATVTQDDTIAIFPGQTNNEVEVPFVYRVGAQRLNARSREDTWLGASLNRRPGVTMLGKVYLFGGNETEVVGPGGVGRVEEVRASCFNNVLDGRETAGSNTADDGDGCPDTGFIHFSGTGITFINTRPVNITSLQGAIDACNAHFGGSGCRQACGTSCPVVNSGGQCSCNAGLLWHFGPDDCFTGQETLTAGIVSPNGCVNSVVGNWR